MNTSSPQGVLEFLQLKFISCEPFRPGSKTDSGEDKVYQLLLFVTMCKGVLNPDL